MTDLIAGADIHDRAVAILASQGRPEGSYTADQYAEAAMQATREAETSSTPGLRTAIEESGLAAPPAAGVQVRVLARAHELLAEQGYADGEWGDRELQSATRIAVSELSAEDFSAAAQTLGLELTRVDFADIPKVLGEAVSAGYVAAGEVSHFSSVLARDGADGARWLFRWRVMRESGTPDSPIFATKAKRVEAAGFRGAGVTVDRDTLGEHQAAEEILRERGRVDVQGALDYTADEYVAALHEVRGGPKRIFARRGA